MLHCTKSSPLIGVGLEVEQQPLLALMQTSQVILNSLKFLLVSVCAQEGTQWSQVYHNAPGAPQLHNNR